MATHARMVVQQECHDFEAGVDSKITNWRTKIIGIEKAFEAKQLKSVYEQIQNLTRYQTHNPIVRSIETANGMCIQDVETMDNLATAHFRNLFTDMN